MPPQVLKSKEVMLKIHEARPNRFMFFLGAGASKSSGAPLASEMVEDFQRRRYEIEEASDVAYEEWLLKQDWFNEGNKYSLLFERYGNKTERQDYVERKLRDAFPVWGYLYLANIIARNWITLVFTTNFDDLLNDALKIYLGYNAIVCAADSQVASVKLIDDRARIIKLHGDYLFEDLKNTSEETRNLEANMRDKFEAFSRQYGMIVLGYGGQDLSVMKILENQIDDSSAFPNGVFWGVRDNQVGYRVKSLAESYPDRFRLFQCNDFDTFLARLHNQLGLDLPPTILQPYEDLRRKYERLIRIEQENKELDSIIREHNKKLRQQLELPWAQSGAAGSHDLLDAQLKLGRRDYKMALATLGRYLPGHDDDPSAYTALGNALFIKAQEEGSEADREAAVENWKKAIQLDEGDLSARYSLINFYVQKQKNQEAIAECLWLLERVPRDKMLRLQLISLYGLEGKHKEALAEVDLLLRAEPNDPQLHLLDAQILEHRGRYDDAVEATRKAVELDQQTPWAHLALATRLFNLEIWDQAEPHYQLAVQLDPENTSFRMNIANFHLRKGLPHLALPHLEKALEIDPESPEIHALLHQAHYAMGYPGLQKAEEAIKQAINLVPRDARYHWYYAHFLLRGGRTEEALDQYKITAGLNRQAPMPYYYQAYCYKILGLEAELAETMKTLQELHPPTVQQLQVKLANWPMALAELYGQIPSLPSGAPAPQKQ